MESLDYRHHRISVNKHSARLDADGGATIVVAHRDPRRPDWPNWLDTTGHGCGTLCLRWVGASHPVHPLTSVVYLGSDSTVQAHESKDRILRS
jgi:hypothetical protein